MRIHYIQHVPFEDPAGIFVWAEKKKHSLTATKLFEQASFPGMEEFDWLIIMGGPMNVYEYDKYQWLADEKEFIRDAISNGKIVLGICLGAQLIADVLGAKITRNIHKEIGWFPVETMPDASNSNIFGDFPSEFMAFHWHGDTFEIPSGCIRLAKSNACDNQSFEYNGRVFGLQFHLESTSESIGKLLDNCGEELINGKYIQPESVIRSGIGRYIESINASMNLLLDSMEKLRI